MKNKWLSIYIIDGNITTSKVRGEEYASVSVTSPDHVTTLIAVDECPSKTGSKLCVTSQEPTIKESCTDEAESSCEDDHKEVI